MGQHVPPTMDKQELSDLISELVELMEQTFDHSIVVDEDYVGGSTLVLDHMREHFDEEVEICRKKTSATLDDEVEKSHWSDPPKGLSVDSLKAVHMALKPVNPATVKNISWEVVCMPLPGKYKDANSRVWVAEVTRRILSTVDKLRVESPEYFVFNVDSKCWKMPDDSIDVEGVFSSLSPGLGLFALLKTAANFGSHIRWADLQTSLDGAVDMRFLDDGHVDEINKAFKDMVSEQLIADGVVSRRAAAADKDKATERWLRNEFAVFPEMVMATLLNLGIVDADPAWVDFV
jgi:hypothetical protein